MMAHTIAIHFGPGDIHGDDSQPMLKSIAFCIGYLARPFQRQGEKTASVIQQPSTTHSKLMPPF